MEQYKFNCDYCKKVNCLDSIQDNKKQLDAIIFENNNKITALENNLQNSEGVIRSLQGEIKIARECNAYIILSYEEKLTDREEREAENEKKRDSKIEQAKENKNELEKRHEELSNKYSDLMKEKDELSKQLVEKRVPIKKSVKFLPDTPEILGEKMNFEKQRANLEAEIRKEYKDMLEKEKEQTRQQIQQIQKNLNSRITISDVKKKTI